MKISFLLIGLVFMAGCIAERQSDIKGVQAVRGQKESFKGTEVSAAFPSLNGGSIETEANLLDIIHRRKLEYKRKQGITSTDATYYVQASPGAISIFRVHEGFCWSQGPVDLPDDWKDSFKNGETPIDTQIETWPVSKAQLFLFSLDPEPGRQWPNVVTERSFHGFTILGKTEITTKHEKTVLLKSFAQGIREGMMQDMCFVPRHGLRVIIGSSTNDFVICFECCSVMVFGFNHGEGFTISDSPSGTFNDSLDRHHVKKTKKDG